MDSIDNLLTFKHLSDMAHDGKYHLVWLEERDNDAFQQYVPIFADSRSVRLVEICTSPSVSPRMWDYRSKTCGVTWRCWRELPSPDEREQYPWRWL